MGGQAALRREKAAKLVLVAEGTPALVGQMSHSEAFDDDEDTFEEHEAHDGKYHSNAPCIGLRIIQVVCRLCGTIFVWPCNAGYSQWYWPADNKHHY